MLLTTSKPDFTDTSLMQSAALSAYTFVFPVDSFVRFAF